MGRETDLPSTGRKRMEEEGKERKGKRKTRSYTSEQKEKTESKACFGFSFLCVCAHRHCKPKGLLLSRFLVVLDFTEDSQGLNMQPGSYLISPGVLIPRGELQHSYDLIDLSAHFLKGEPSVPLCLLGAAASAALRRHKDLYG